MGVRPLNGLVSIAECSSRFEADTAVALLAASGIDATVVADPAHGVAPHLVTDRSFSVLVRIGIADDAQQALVRGAGSPPSPLVHPTLRGRGVAPASPPSQPPAAAPDDAAEEGDWDDTDGWSDDRPLGRPRWIKVVSWATVGSVVLPLLAGAARTVANL